MAGLWLTGLWLAGRWWLAGHSVCWRHEHGALGGVHMYHMLGEALQCRREAERARADQAVNVGPPGLSSRAPRERLAGFHLKRRLALHTQIFDLAHVRRSQVGHLGAQLRQPSLCRLVPRLGLRGRNFQLVDLALQRLQPFQDLLTGRDGEGEGKGEVEALGGGEAGVDTCSMGSLRPVCAILGLG